MENKQLTLTTEEIELVDECLALHLRDLTEREKWFKLVNDPRLEEATKRIAIFNKLFDRIQKYLDDE